MSDVGQFGAPTTSNSGNPYSGGNGIDLNLKNGAYGNIEIDNFHLTNTGASDRDGVNATGDKNGGAIVIEARDAGSYTLVSATVNGTITVHDGTIDGHTSTGIQVGEPGQANAHGPSVTVSAVAISGEQQSALPNGHGDVANVTNAAMTVNMLNGGDSLIVSPTTTGTMIVNGGTGADTITTGDGSDQVTPGAGSDTVNTGGGNDTVFGTADAAVDNFDGGSGTDTIDYSALSAAQPVSIMLGANIAGGAATGSDTLTNFENATGGAGNDSLFGSNTNNVLHGGAGDDNIVGSGGSDTLYGDAGTDTLNGGVNDFATTPSAANDILWGGDGVSGLDAIADTFKFEGRFGSDHVMDWTTVDTIQLVGYAPFQGSMIVSQSGADTIISVNDGSVGSDITVHNATASVVQSLVHISGNDILIH